MLYAPHRIETTVHLQIGSYCNPRKRPAATTSNCPAGLRGNPARRADRAGVGRAERRYSDPAGVAHENDDAVPELRGAEPEAVAARPVFACFGSRRAPRAVEAGSQARRSDIGA